MRPGFNAVNAAGQPQQPQPPMDRTISSRSDDDQSTTEELSGSSLSIEVEHRVVGSEGEHLLKQPVFLRYLEPYIDTPTTVNLPTPPEPNPIILVQKDDEQEIPKPLIYREIPTEPDHVVHVVKPSTPPRPVIIESIERDIPKPPPILIERWLPPRYPRAPSRITTGKKQKRKVIVVERTRPKVKVVKEYVNLGTRKVNSKEYAKMIEATARNVVLNNKAVFVESRMSWDDFRRETGDWRSSVGFTDDVKRRGMVTLLGEGQLRI